MSLKKKEIREIQSLIDKKLSRFLSNPECYNFTIKFASVNERKPFRLPLIELPKWSTLISYKNWLYIVANVNSSLENIGRINKNRNICSIYTGIKGFSGEVFTDALRSCFHYYLERENGIFIHASGVRLNTEGFVFAGPAQAGKSTIGRLISKGRTISDECIMIKKNSSSYYMYSTPFCYKDENRSARLKGIFFLKKSKKLSIEKISKPDAVKYLFSNIWLSGQDENIAGLNFENILKIADKVPCYHLNFALNSPVQSYINKLV